MEDFVLSMNEQTYRRLAMDLPMDYLSTTSARHD